MLRLELATALYRTSQALTFVCRCIVRVAEATTNAADRLREGA